MSPPLSTLELQWQISLDQCASATPVPEREQERLNWLQRLGILDTDFERAYDDIVQLAGTICGVPIALISFIDEQRQWFKARVGIDVRETPRELAFCAHAIMGREIFEVGDASLDPRFRDNELVTGEPRIRFYAGAPLLTPSGLALGTVCVIDRIPRQLTQIQRDGLQCLSRQVMQLLTLRTATQVLNRQTDSLLATVEAHDYLMSVVAHDLRAPFISQVGLCDLIDAMLEAGDAGDAQRKVAALRASALSAAQLVDNLLAWSLRGKQAMQPQPETLAATDAIEEVWQVYQVSAQSKQITLTLSGNLTLNVHADRNLLRSILMNLLGNALKFSPPARPIVIDLSVSDRNEACIAVIDRGVGITADQVAALFNGEWAESTRGTLGERGSGLGLRLCEMLAKRSGGSINAQSELGVGSRFCLRLPQGPSQ